MAAVSLAMCLATAGLWVRSYWVWDTFAKQSYKHDESELRTHGFVSFHGRLCLSLLKVKPVTFSATEWEKVRSWTWSRVPDASQAWVYGNISQRLGFGWVSRTVPTK